MRWHRSHTVTLLYVVSFHDGVTMPLRESDAPAGHDVFRHLFIPVLFFSCALGPGADVNAVDADGMTPVSFAVLRDDWAAAAAVVTVGRDSGGGSDLGYSHGATAELEPSVAPDSGYDVLQYVLSLPDTDLGVTDQYGSSLWALARLGGPATAACLDVAVRRGHPGPWSLFSRLLVLLVGVAMRATTGVGRARGRARCDWQRLCPRG